MSDDTDFLGGETGTEEATDLYFLVGEDGAEAFCQASVETVVEAVDEWIEVFPQDEFFYGHLVVAQLGQATEQGLVLCGGCVCHEANHCLSSLVALSEYLRWLS